MKTFWKRTGALALTACMLASVLLPAGAYELPAAYDETYYATLDPYGALTQGSVVKSYRLNGRTSLTDYGTYDAVTNLTDSRQAAVKDGAVTFDFSGDGEAPDRFFFQADTARPFEELPWRIAVSYKLNGAPARAEDLAGKTGLIEIDLDATPNPAAGEYFKTNLVLMAAAVFNDDDLTSLEAPGAQIQLIGNLRAVLFAVLPGEEDHYAIRVGMDSFEFSGLMLLAVPATLEQLDQLADLREVKEEGKDSLDAIDESLDVILDTLNGMSGSLNATANGLDKLNAARSQVNAGKGQVYDSTDAALAGLDGLTQSLGRMDPYLTEASQAVTDTVEAVNGLHQTALELTPQLSAARDTVAALQEDTAVLRSLLGDVESYNKRATDISKSLADQLDDLEDETEDLEFRLDILESRLDATKGISALEKLKPISVGGMTDADEIKTQWNTVKNLHGQYEASKGSLPENTSFQDFIILGAFSQFQAGVKQQLIAALKQTGLDETTATAQATAMMGMTAEQLAGAVAAGQLTQEQAGAIAAAQDIELFKAQTDVGKGAVTQAKQADEFWNTVQGMGGEAAMEKQLEQMTQVNELIPSINQYVLPGVNDKIDEVNSLITNLTKPTADLMGSLSDLVETVGDSGMGGDLSNLARLCRDLLKTMKEYEGSGALTLSDLDRIGAIVDDLTQVCDDALADLTDLNTVVNTYEPTLQGTLTELQSASGSLQTALGSMKTALQSAEDLLKSSGPNLNAGTDQTLSALAEALRRSTVGLEQTGTISGAKETLNGLVEDQWETHTGGVDTLLNMDSQAPAVSMTSSRNGTPESIQYILRTQEITVKEAETEENTVKETDNRTFWQRVVDLFKGIWSDITSLFSGKKD